jgi:outer membrane protein, heavy metal efflux system
MRTGTTLVALATFASAAPAQQQGTGGRSPAVPIASRDTLRLTRSEAVRMALANNPQLEVARQQAGGARARRVQAIAVPDPALTASLDDKSRLLGPAASRNVGVELGVPFPDKFRLRNAVARADVQSADFQYTLLRQQIAAAVARGYDDLLVARRHRRDLTDQRGLAAEFLQKAEARFNAGSVARLDVIRARVDVAQADNALIANERDISNAEAALNRLLGRSLGAGVMAADSLDIPLALPALEQLELRALAVRPELSDLQAQRRGASAATSLAREYWLPDFFLAANKDYKAGGGPLFSTGIALPFPLFFWQHSKGEIAESRARERELAASYRDLQAEVSQDVRAAYAFAETSLRQALYLRDELLPAAQEAYRVASVSYGLGGSSALEVLDARRNLLDAETQYADALAAASSARSDLERAVGAPLDALPAGGSRE